MFYTTIGRVRTWPGNFEFLGVSRVVGGDVSGNGQLESAGNEGKVKYSAREADRFGVPPVPKRLSKKTTCQ